MSLLNNNRKTNLLFRQFVGTSNALLPENSNFTNEPLKNINFVFNTEIQNQEVPLTLPNELRISQLDICSNIPSDSSFNLAAYGYPQLTFYKNIPLDPVPGAASQVWFKYIDISANPLTNQSNNLLIGMIPFKFDDINVLDPTYLPIVKRNFAVPPLTNFVNVGAPNNTPLYWIQNANNGLIQFYASTPTLNANNIQDITSGGVQDVTKAPTLSFYKYTGTFGTNVGSGSGSNVDSSAINLKFDKLNRMILPDGFVDISGTNYDLCGNETVRTYYTYNRAQMFVGYDNLPILDGSAVDHTQDPSHNDFSGLGQRYQLDVSGTIYFSNNIIQSSSFAGGTNSAAFGSLNFAGSQNAFAIGLGNEANGVRSFAYGQETTANGTNSCSQGLFTNAVGQNSHSEGISTNARGRGSHSEGLQTDASGTESHAEGILTKAYGNWSHAEGGESEAHNPYSHASGRHTIIGSDAGTSIGKYNDASQNILFVIGDGTSDTSRSDALIVHVDGNLSIFNDISMNGGQITFIADATDNSGVPSWGQVQNLITSGAGSYWIQSGTNLYYNSGNVGIGTATPSTKLDINGSINVTENADIQGYAQVSGNLLVATDSTDLTATGITDYNAYFRQTNIIDTMKLPFDIYFDGFWKYMVDRTISGAYTWRQGLPCPFGPNLIPIAKIDINGSYSNSTPASQEELLRPLLANTIGYFTVKFAQPSMQEWDEGNPIKPEFSADGTWVPTMGVNGTKPGYNCIPEQTIHFVAGYQEQQYNIGDENRNPKPFIKILSCSFGDIRNVNGETIIFTNSDPVTDPNSGAYTGKKIGGITRIVIAEGLIKLHPGQKGVPVPVEDTSGKAWLFLEQTWAYEGWMPRFANRQEEILRKICGDHNIEVRLYSNNTGAKMPERPNKPPEMKYANLINTDWQLLSVDLMKPYITNWRDINKQPSFLLGGLPGTLPLPTGPPNFVNTLFVGGQQNPPGLTIGIGETQTPQLWFVDLNVYDWPYGITTTKEIFKYNVDICGNLYGQNSIFENITVNNQATIGTNGNIKIGPVESTFVGITNNGTLTNNDRFTNNGNVDISGDLYIGNGGGTGFQNNMITKVISRVNNSIALSNSQLNGSFGYYKLASINLASISDKLDYFTCNGFFELNYYNTSSSYNGSGKSATMHVIRCMVGGTMRPLSPTTYKADNLYIKILSNQYQGPNTSDILFKQLVLIANDNNELILYAEIFKPLTGVTGRYTMRIYQDTNDLNGGTGGDSLTLHNPNTNWKLYDDVGQAYLSTGIPTTPTIINRYDLNLSLQAPTTTSIDGIDIRYTDTLGNLLQNSNVINTQPAFFQQYTKFDKGIDMNNTKIINNRGLLGKNQSIIGNNVGTTPNSDDMYIESLEVVSNINIRVQPNQKIIFKGRDGASPGTESINPIDINPLGNGTIDMNFNGTNNIKGVNNLDVNNLEVIDISATNIDVSNNLNVLGITTAPTIKNIDFSGTNIDLAATGIFRLKDNNTGAAANYVIDANSTNNKVNFGGYDYTGGSNIIGTPTAIDRVIVDLQAGSTQFGLNVADSGSVIQTLGGIKILPLQSNSLGAPPNYAAPGWGASLFLGEWGWGNQNWNNHTTIKRSQSTNDHNRPGSGNVYCNAVRQNIVFSDLNTQGPTWNAGYQGQQANSMYYNQGDIRYIVIDPTNGSNNYATVTLPAIQSPMLGQAITVARTMVPDNFANYDAGLLVKASTGDRINCPHSIFIDDNNFGGISIDPHNVMGNTPNPGFDLPTPYKGNEICSITLVACQNGYYNTNINGSSSGSAITNQYVWQFISSGGPGI